jgi:hypothetical protein
MIRRYATPLAFKQALEQRIKSSSTTGVDFARRRQLLVFDRFLARVALVVGDAVTLKGGLALEMRLTRARTTKDIDLRMMGSADNVLDRLQSAGRLDLDAQDGDWHASVWGQREAGPTPLPQKALPPGLSGACRGEGHLSPLRIERRFAYQL